LAGHYDLKSEISACTRCDGQEANTNQYPHRADRRQKCAAGLNTSGTAQPSVAQYVTGSLASSVITAGEQHFVRRSVPTASISVRTATADGYVDFQPPPDNSYGAHRAPPANVYRQFDTVFCFALEGAT
jgi:hypothetical protein